MKTAKILFTLISMLLFSVAGMAQSDIQQMAEEKADQINADIVSINPDAALTTEQREKIVELHIARTMKIRDIKTGDGTEEEKSAMVKEAIKEFNATVNNEVLTKEQLKAKRAAASAKNE